MTEPKSPDASTDSDLKMFEEHLKIPENGDAIKNGLLILRRLEFRAIRAAKMNYSLSETYSNRYQINSIISSSVAGFATFFQILYTDAKSNFGFTEMLTAGKDLLVSGNAKSLLLITLPLCVGGLCLYVACPKFLLLYLKEKEEQHNNAGAAWQALEIKINAFLETTPKGEMSWKRIQDAIFEFSKERQEACKLACPDDKTRDTVINNPSLLAKIVHDRNRTYMEFRKELEQLENNAKETPKQRTDENDLVAVLNTILSYFA